jgi:hypothetical protein
LVVVIRFPGSTEHGDFLAHESRSPTVVDPAKIPCLASAVWIWSFVLNKGVEADASCSLSPSSGALASSGTSKRMLVTRPLIGPSPSSSPPSPSNLERKASSSATSAQRQHPNPFYNLAICAHSWPRVPSNNSACSCSSCKTPSLSSGSSLVNGTFSTHFG